MDLYKLEKLPMRPLIYGTVALYLVLDLLILKGPLYKRIEPLIPGGEANVSLAEERGWACTVNGEPITKAQLNLAVDLELAKEGERRENSNEGRLRILQHVVLRRMIFDKLIEQKAVYYEVETPREYIDRRIEIFETQFTPGQLKDLCEKHKLSQKKLRQLLTAHARQQFWLEHYAIKYGIEEMDNDVEKTAREWFENFGGKMVIPETVRARQIFLSTVLPFWTDDLPPFPRLALQVPNVKRVETRIREIHARLESGTPFAELVSQSEDERSKRAGGDLGYFSRNRMPREFTEPVFELQTNEVSEPFRTGIGWHIVEVSERLPERPMTWEEARPEVLTFQKNEWRAWAVDWFIDDRLWIKRQAVVIQFPIAEIVDRY